MQDIQNSQSQTTGCHDDVASEPASSYNSQPQMMEHLRYQGVETLMKIDDLSSLRILIPQIQKIFYYTAQVNINGKNAERLQQSLNAISNYQDNWDGEDAPAIIPSVIESLREVISHTNDYLLENWSIFPSTNGTLKMETHQPKVNAGINIGAEEFSYFIHSGTDEIYGKSSITRKHIQNILTQVYYGE